MKLHVVLQTLGLTGFPLAALLAFGIPAAVAVGSVSLVVAGVVLELDRRD